MDELIPLYRQRLNLQGATFSKIDHDDAMVATVYRVAQTNGEQLILKICARAKDYLCEVYFLNHFANQLPVPKILQEVSPESGLHGAILMQCLPGSLLKIADVTEALAYEMGSCLARIHQHQTSGYGDLTDPSGLSPDPRKYFTLKFNEGFEECRDHLPKDLTEQCRRYYDRNSDLLILADGPCIVHRDFRPGNILVQEGKLEGIIDWSSARASFAQEDFCPLEHYEWPTNPSNRKSFFAGYASIRTVPDYSAMMPLLRLAKAFATIGFMVKRGTWDGIHARVYQLNRQFLETFFLKQG